MRLVYDASDSLPGLAWCARVRRGSPEMRVRHGAWVETRDDCFFEAAWDGPYDAGRFDTAVSMVGTGARATPGGVVFAASTNLYDRLYSVRAGDELFVANSLAFALVEAGCELKPDYAFYPGEFLLQALAGIRRRNRELPLRRGSAALHECANLLLEPDLTLRRAEKVAPAEPVAFADYVGLLRETIARVVENATDPRRQRTFAPLATVSRGYDAAAVAALTRPSLCAEAITFVDDLRDGPTPEDNGKPVGVCLGLEMTEYQRRGYAQRGGWPEAEFCACPLGTDVMLASAEEQLAGRLLLTGRFGDDVWTSDPAMIQPDLRQHTPAGLGGMSLTEFRLRVGFLHFPPLFTASQYIPAIHRIQTSEEMRPWSLGGNYDRPIPRRILEEAGVPRELFGQAKSPVGGGLSLNGPGDLADASRADFLAFCAANRPLRRSLRRAQALRALHRLGRKADRALTRAAAALGSPRRVGPSVSPRYALHPMRNLLFRWGFERTSERYRAHVKRE